MWYVMRTGSIVDAEFYAAEKLGDALSLARAYRAVLQLRGVRRLPSITVVKCGGVSMQAYIDGTQAHYI